ncbi:MAG TPA: alpha/beta fold hydrolase [Ktedonobacterales bacterium]|nr:alpha/beta fold hydrolase [Ktedonobacterales bacterium]
MADDATAKTQRPRRASAASKATTGAKTKTTRASNGAGNSATATRALAEERRKLASVEADLAREREKLARAEEELERERRRADTATAALEAARQQAAPPPRGADKGATPSSAERTAKSAGAGELPPWLNPLENLPGAELFATGQRMALAAMKQPWIAMQQSGELLGEVARIATGQSQIEPEPKDKRFADPVWKTNPLYKAALQSYLLWRQSLNTLVDSADLPKQDADRARFALSLMTEAMAPTNTMLGNPAAMRRLYETGGASAVRGLTHMIEDLANNGGLPSQVDMKAFEVGKNLAVSKGAVVFKNEVLELIQYTPQTETVYGRPLLCVPPQINKFYILDLSPGKSVVEYLTHSGFTLFTISWRNPTVKQRDWGVETYVKAILEATDVVRDITGQEAINITGACAGGMTLALALGHLAAKGDTRMNAATFMVTVLDSRIESTMGLFATPETVAAAKLASKARGVLEGQEMARIFAWLRPNDLIWNYWVNNYLIGNDPAAFDILYWNNDTTRLPSKFHTELLDFALKNPVVKRGALKVLGTPIDLSKVTVDTFITAGITDHITPWQGCYATTQLLGGRPEFVLSSAGHIQSILNPPGNPKAKYFAGAEYPADPEQWLARAQPRSGSWWERWRDWLGERSGERVPAPTTLGSKRYPAGAAAPGTYVFEP